MASWHLSLQNIGCYDPGWRNVPASFGGLLRHVAWRLVPLRARTKQKTTAKPAAPRKTAIARLVQPVQPDIDDDADDRQRVGVQSLGRAFAILEEVARHREGIGLADLSKLVGLHNSTTFHLAKTMVSLGYMRQEKESKRYRVGRPLFALAASALDEVEMMSLAMPILEQLSRDAGEAAQILKAAGFQVAFNDVLGGFFNTVRGSDPAAGTMARKGSTITLTIV